MKFFIILLGSLLFLCIPITYILNKPEVNLLDQTLQSVIGPMAAIIYFGAVKRKRIFFTLFISSFAIADVLSFFLPAILDFASFYVINGLYIVAYSSLFLEISTSMRFSVVFKNFKFQVLILIGLSIYVLFTLQNLANYIYFGQYLVEIIYNASVLLALSGSLLNFFYHFDKKSFYFLVGSFLLLTQEFLAIGFMYIVESNTIFVMMCIFSIMAFYFLIEQTSFQYKKRNPFLGD